MVLCVDEKPQIQTLERSQPVLRMRPGSRSGHPRLPPARNHVVICGPLGEVLGRCFPRHRAVEFRRFLDTSRKRSRRTKFTGVDNYGTHDGDDSRLAGWPAALPSALHANERISTRTNGGSRRLPNGITHRSRRAGGGDRGVTAHNANPKPFIWTKSADQILESLKIYNAFRRQTRLTVHPRETIIFPKRGGAILTNKKRILAVRLVLI